MPLCASRYVPITSPGLALSYVQPPRSLMLAAKTRLQDPFQLLFKPRSTSVRSLSWTRKGPAICVSAECLWCRCNGKILLHAVGKCTSSSLRKIWPSLLRGPLPFNIFFRHFENCCESWQCAGNEMSSRAPSSDRRALLRGRYKALWTEERSASAGRLKSLRFHTILWGCCFTRTARSKWLKRFLLLTISGKLLTLRPEQLNEMWSTSSNRYFSFFVLHHLNTQQCEVTHLGEPFVIKNILNCTKILPWYRFFLSS